jgi:hypothetical protein
VYATSHPGGRPDYNARITPVDSPTSESAHRREPPSRTRRWAVRIAAVIAVYLACELLLFVANIIAFGRVFTFSAAAPREVTAGSDPFRIANVPARLRIRKEVVHPYMGYVYDPTVESASPYGISDVSPLQTRRADALIVGVFGGSFAEDLANEDGAGGLAAQLGPYFPGRKIVTVKLAIGGYKQPQQLMSLAYFTALGGEFDLVINVDGFNEIALPGIENLPATNPFFPRQWHLRVRTVPDAEMIATVGEIRVLDSLARRWAGLFSSGPLRYSVTANTVWRIGDRLLFDAAVARRAQLPKMVRADGYVASGPPVTYSTPAEQDAALGRLWAESSHAMHALATANGARYFHFLQPNQYVAGSKPMQAAERRVAIQEGGSYSVAVSTGYPILRQLGEELRGKGVNFVDLTSVYGGNSGEIYVDTCCHVNENGRSIVIAAIAKTVGARLQE